MMQQFQFGSPHPFCLHIAIGDNECGKTTLIAKLQGNEDPKKGAGLEYMYIDVKDEYRDGKSERLLLTQDLRH